MDQELGVKERNWRNILCVPEQRGQHYRYYRNDLDNKGSSYDSAMSNGSSPARKVHRLKDEADKNELDKEVCCS